MKKTILTIISLFFLASSVLAIGISGPLVRNHELYPGASYEQEVRLKRSIAQDDIKALMVIDAPEIEDWISIYPSKEFILPAGETSIPMIVRIDVPETAEQKKYTGYIRVNSVSLEEEAGVAISIGSRITLDLEVIETPVVLTTDQDLVSVNYNLLIIFVAVLILLIIILMLSKKKKTKRINVVLLLLVLTSLGLSLGINFDLINLLASTPSVPTSVTVEGSSGFTDDPVVLNGNSNIDLNLRPDTTSVAVVGTVEHPGGHAEIGDVTAVIYRGTGNEACSANDNNCYHISTGNCAESSCGGTSCVYTCTATFKYYADPTDAGSPFEAQQWFGTMIVKDDGITADEKTSSGVNLITNLALTITEETIAYGEVDPGEDTEDTNQTITIINAGNASINVEVSGTNMEKAGNGEFIVVGQQKYHTSGFTYSTGGTALTGTPAEVTLSLGKPTDSGTISDDMYWGIAIPEGISPGVYSGTNSFTAVAD